MLTKILLNKKSLITGVIAASFYAVAVFASAEITFPVQELGNCADKEACREYCNDPDNIPACQAFAESRGMVKKQENSNKQGANKLAEAIKKGGPGGCTDFDSCRDYCQNPDHQAECRAFAEANGLTPPRGPQGEDGRGGGKAEQLLKSGRKLPGNCRNDNECRQYCSVAAHQDECIKFGRENNLIPKNDSQKLDVFLSLVEAGETPGGCKTKEECRIYCSTSEHASECADFMRKLGVTGNKPNISKPPMPPQSQKPQIPPEALSCLREHLNETDFNKFTENTQNIRPEIVDIAKRCFQNLQNQNMEIRKCIPRPACLDSTPRCMLAEPAGGWCSGTLNTEEAPHPTPMSCEDGYLWNGQECVNMAGKCQAAGGQWNSDNNTCLRPSFSPPPIRILSPQSSNIVPNKLVASFLNLLLGR
jgi:hypothetical protein